MKIVVVCDVLGKINNGTSMAAYNLISYLKDCGHNVKVICPDLDKLGEKDFFIVKKRSIPIVNKIYKKNGVVMGKPDREILEAALKDADRVHILLPFVVGRAAIKICEKNNIPLSISFHCQAENVTTHLGMQNIGFINNTIYRGFYRKAFKHVNVIHYPTKFIKDTFERIVGPTNGVVISNGVSDTFKPITANKPISMQKKFVLLSIGRLCGEKQHMVTLKAIQKSKYKNQIQLIFIGNGPLNKQISNYATKHLLPNQLISYTAILKKEEILEIINYSDLFIHPASIELEGIAVLEAIVCGLVPIVSNSKKAATKNFSLSEHTIFQVFDHNDLAKKIDYLLENEALRMSLRTQYIEFGKQFYRSLCMQKMEQMIVNMDSTTSVIK